MSLRWAFPLRWIAESESRRMCEHARQARRDAEQSGIAMQPPGAGAEGSLIRPRAIRFGRGAATRKGALPGSRTLV